MTPLAPAPAAAQQQAGADDILSHVISVPTRAPIASTAPRPARNRQVRNDSTVQGGKALRVQVPGRSEQAWTTAVSVPINRADP